MNRRDRSGIPSERQHMTCVRIIFFGMEEWGAPWRPVGT
jgi:hypothetical protein